MVSPAVAMPGGSGLDLLPAVPAGTQVVFVTAHEKYAVEACAVSALDYLAEPVCLERLFETVHRREEKTTLRRLKTALARGEASPDDGEDVPCGSDDESSDAGTAAGPATSRGRMRTDMIHLSRASKKRAAAGLIGDIRWIESLQNHTRVGPRNAGRIAVFRRRLRERETDLPAGFSRGWGRRSWCHPR